MQWTYGALFLLSLSLLPLYFLFVRKKQNEPWLLFLSACVAVVNFRRGLQKNCLWEAPLR